MRVQKIFALAAAALVLSGAGFSFAQAARTPAESVAYRQEQMRRVGATFKAIRDGSARSQPDLAAIRANARTLSQLAQELPTWFPADSAMPVGEKNRARPEIWSNAPGFAERTQSLQSATRDLANATTIEAVRTQMRAVAPQCSRCHDVYTADD